MKRAIPFAACLCALVATAPAEPLHISSQELPKAILGVPYDAAVQIASDCRCPAGDTGLWMAAGALPKGLELGPDRLRGLPREMGIFRFAIGAANGCSQSTKDFTLIVTGRPVLHVEPGELVFEYRAGDPAPELQRLLVSSTWPGLAYTVATGADWLSSRQSAGATPAQESALAADSVAVRVKPEKLAPGTYRATVVVSAWRAANAPAIPITLKVSGEK